MPGLANGLEHGVIGGVATLQHGDPVARDQFASGNPVPDCGQGGNIGAGKGCSVMGRAPDLCILQAPQSQRPARHPVDAEHVIEKGAENRRQPGSRDPAQGGAYIAFFQKDIDRNQDRQKQIDSDNHRFYHVRRPGYGDGKHINSVPLPSKHLCAPDQSLP